MLYRILFYGGIIISSIIFLLLFQYASYKSNQFPLFSDVLNAFVFIPSYFVLVYAIIHIVTLLFNDAKLTQFVMSAMIIAVSVFILSVLLSTKFLTTLLLSIVGFLVGTLYLISLKILYGKSG